ncbi:MAG: ybgC [Burkholderiaceae bacterium]|nr:ybgC [Burkholderiaceae bacterium]
MATMPQSFHWPVRVYFEDTDSGGVVYYANYLKFFERARTEWLRAAGVSQQVLMEQHCIMFVVAGVTLDYLAPARLDDELSVTVVAERLGRASVQVAQQVWRGDLLLASGNIRVVCVDSLTMKPKPVPAEVLAKMRAQV